MTIRYNYAYLSLQTKVHLQLKITQVTLIMAPSKCKRLAPPSNMFVNLPTLSLLHTCPQFSQNNRRLSKEPGQSKPLLRTYFYRLLHWHLYHDLSYFAIFCSLTQLSLALLVIQIEHTASLYLTAAHSQVSLSIMNCKSPSLNNSKTISISHSCIDFNK